MRGSIVWVEKLGVAEICILGVRRFFSNLEVRYDRHNVTEAAKRALGFFKFFRLSVVFFAVSLSLEKRGLNSPTLQYRADENLRACINRFNNETSEASNERYRNMFRCYIAAFLRKRLTFAAAVEGEVDSMINSRDVKHEIYFSRHPLNIMIMALYEEKGFVVKQSACYMEHLKFFVRPLYCLTVLFFCKVLSLSIKNNLDKVKPSIWVEYSHKDAVDFVFWKDYVNTETFDIVNYLDRPDTPPSMEVTDAIEGSGLKWVDSHLFPMAGNMALNRAVLSGLLRPLFSWSLHRPVWQSVFDFEHAFWLALYKSAFERFNVKMLIQHQDSSWKQEVQARAIETAGGVMLGFHWSNYPCRMAPLHLFPFHVFFVWGAIFRDLVEHDSHTCTHILPSGLWGLSGRAEHQEGFVEKAGFAISVFDSSVAYGIHQTPDTLALFYEKIICLLEKRPHWSCFIKSKNWGVEDFMFLPRGEELVMRMQTLVAQNRLVVIDRTVSPTVAASLSDLAVCYGLNSAGIVAAIHGVPAIHWDCSGWTKHPFYKDTDQKIIFRDINDFEQAIEKAAAGDNSIGDFSKWRRAFNCFDDRKAPERVGRFIQTFMQTVADTGDMKHSLDFSVKKYIQENGVGEDFLATQYGWEDEA